MRIDARDAGFYKTFGPCWNAWDCERCVDVKQVVWADEESAQWGRYARDSTGKHLRTESGDALVCETIQERRIDIYPEQRLVLFNQIEDVDRCQETASALAC